MSEVPPYGRAISLRAVVMQVIREMHRSSSLVTMSVPFNVAKNVIWSASSAVGTGTFRFRTWA